MKDIPWEDIFKLIACAAASEFCEWVQVDIDVYIPQMFISLKIVYQVKPQSPSWFSAACDGAIVPRNHFFHLYQQNKSSESKVKFGTSGLGFRDFWQIANCVLKKGKSAIPPLFNSPEVL